MIRKISLLLFDIGHWDLAPGITANEDSHREGVQLVQHIFCTLLGGLVLSVSHEGGRCCECCLHIVLPTGSSR